MTKTHNDPPEINAPITSNRIPDVQEAEMILELIRDDEVELKSLSDRLRQCAGRVSEWKGKITEIEKSLILSRRLEKIAQARLKASRTISQILNNNDLADTDREADDEVSENYFASTSLRYRLEIPRARNEKEKHLKEVEEAIANVTCLETALESYTSALAHAQITQKYVFDYSCLVKKSLQNKQVLLSAGRRIPTEILLCIFDVVLAMEIGAIRDGFSSAPSQISFLLSSICHRWRQLTISYAPLWSYIPLFYRTEEGRMDVRDIYLQRACQKERLILHVPQIIESAPLPLRLNDSLSLSKLIQGAKSLELLGESPWAVRAAGKFKAYYVRNLLPSFSERTPTIQYLFLDIKSYITPGEVQMIFRFLNKLKQFHLRSRYPIYAPVHSDNMAISMLELKEVSMAPEVLNILLASYIVAPALSHIVLTDHVADTTPNNHTSLDQFLPKGIARRVIHLGLVGKYNSEATRDYYQPLLEGCTAIKTLELSGSFFDGIVKELADDVQLSQNLQHLILRDTDISPLTLRNFIEKRSVRELTIDHCPHIDRDFCEELNKAVPELHVLY